MAALKPGQTLLLHEAPVYPTTLVTIEAMGLERLYVDLNDLATVKKTAKRSDVDFALLQHTHQRMGDRYRLVTVINTLKAANPQISIIVDDNYAALRVPKIGIQMGANVSTFSLFKLLGPEGIGCVLASGELISRIRQQTYSGGTQVQGTEAMDALRSLVYAPVALAIQAEVVNEVVDRLNSCKVKGVRRAYVANAQSRVLLVELEKPLAKEVLEKSLTFGAAGHPVGAESRYEVAPLFYRVSGTFIRENPKLAVGMIRINPMRAGPGLVIDILEKSLKACQ